MNENKFKNILSHDEEIIWCNNINVKACILKGLPLAILFGGIFSLFIVCFFGPLLFSEKWEQGPYLVPVVYILPIIVIIYLIYTILNAKNSYFCITNKRVIKMSGAFKSTFIHYSLKNIGTIRVSGTIFDNDNSADLLIMIKDFHSSNYAYNLKICSLNNAYDAYNKLTGLTEGNNEYLRVKSE